LHTHTICICADATVRAIKLGCLFVAA